jgi:hypothetical protein
MFASFALALGFFVAGKAGVSPLPPDWAQTLIIVGVTTLAWVATALLTRPESDATLGRFYRLIRPGGPGWRPFLDRSHARGELLGYSAAWSMGRELTFALAGCVAIYGFLFATGFVLYGRATAAAIAGAATVAGSVVVALTWRGVASGPTQPAEPALPSEPA